MDNSIGFDLDDHTGLVQPAFNAAGYRVDALEDLAMCTDKAGPML